MSRICGIDLGTTNSLIGHGEDLYSGLVSSSIDITKKAQVERDVFNENIVSSYKVNMTIGDSGKLPIACSSIILADLARRASRVLGETITDVAISVPAKFSDTQRKAVEQAAEKAGLIVHGLINEPTAAALYACKENKDLVIVYDLGGGTFDATLLDSRAGNYFVLATDGDGYLAGDNFDRAIVNRAIAECNVKIRYCSNENIERLKILARKAKEALQKNGLPQYIDMTCCGVEEFWTLTKDVYLEIMKDVFAPTLKITNQMLRANLMPTDKPKIVFVGGSTACPYLRAWIKESTGLDEIEVDCPPDLIVAKGVALYAKMLEDGTAAEEIEDVTKCLCIEDNLGMADVIVEKNTIIPVTEVRNFINTEDTQFLIINLYQGDSLICKENEYIGTLEYDYGEVKKAGEGLVEVEVEVDRNGKVALRATDITTCITQEVKLVIR